MSQQEIPQPTFPHRVYGVDITSFGEEGGYAAQGHVPDLRFTAACNHMARRTLMLTNACDDSYVSLEDFALNIKRIWAVPVDPAEVGDEFEWAVEWDGVAKDAPGAIPMTVWEP